MLEIYHEKTLLMAPISGGAVRQGSQEQEILNIWTVTLLTQLVLTHKILLSVIQQNCL